MTKKRIILNVSSELHAAVTAEAKKDRRATSTFLEVTLERLFQVTPVTAPTTSEVKEHTAVAPEATPKSAHRQLRPPTPEQAAAQEKLLRDIEEMRIGQPKPPSKNSLLNRVTKPV